ncbi:hypothetical protein SLS58_007179 [Diplodia intermedia]|uniref:non-specific serine/threonine protein kinase n=1 Tax=Diplodia intermedia TaxID=856260 RepID=A0ABR3TL26_9PEZI
MDASSLSIGARLGEGGSSHVHEVSDGNTTYACKLFFSKDAFEAEKAAYERIERVDALRGRVPKLYSVPVPFVIIMENVRGDSLDDAAISTSERVDIEKQLTETLELLHREAGIYHGDIYARNVIVKDGCAKLLDFSNSVLQENIPESQHEKFAKEDHRALRSIFFEMGKEEAYDEAMRIIDNMRTSCLQQGFNGEEKLAELLPRTGASNKELLDAVITVLPAPPPSIAFWVARRLSWSSRSIEAVKILKSCLARYEMAESTHSISSEEIMELKWHAARFAGRGRHFEHCEKGFSAEELYEDAIAFYLRSDLTPDQRGGADEKVLDLRFELVKQLAGNGRYTAALRVCVRALEEAGVSGREDGEKIIFDFMRTMKSLLEHVEDRELWDRAAKLIQYDGKTFEQCRAEDWR